MNIQLKKESKCTKNNYSNFGQNQYLKQIPKEKLSYMKLNMVNLQKIKIIMKNKRENKRKTKN